MVAASPERHDGGLQANPVEVQSYQPPWKVLSDFALQSDIDQPAFQQLVSLSCSLRVRRLNLQQREDSGLTVTPGRIQGGWCLPGLRVGERGRRPGEEEASTQGKQASCESFL